MTNREKIIAILKPRKDQIRIYGNWVEIEIQKLGINFSCELDWWNTECNEPTTKNDLGVDCVNRKEVEELVYRFLRECTDENIAFYEHLLDLTSVTPQEPRKGYWIIDGHHRRCSECDEYFCIKDAEGNEIPSSFCPNCGTDMREVEE